MTVTDTHVHTTHGRQLGVLPIIAVYAGLSSEHLSMVVTGLGVRTIVEVPTNRADYVLRSNRAEHERTQRVEAYAQQARADRLRGYYRARPHLPGPVGGSPALEDDEADR